MDKEKKLIVFHVDGDPENKFKALKVPSHITLKGGKPFNEASGEYVCLDSYRADKILGMCDGMHDVRTLLHRTVLKRKKSWEFFTFEVSLIRRNDTISSISMLEKAKTRLEEDLMEYRKVKDREIKASVLSEMMEDLGLNGEEMGLEDVLSGSVDIDDETFINIADGINEIYSLM